MSGEVSFLEDEQAVLRACEMVGERWASAVAPVYVEPDKRSVTAHGVGTMFLGSAGDRIFLITAHHVIERSKALSYRVVNIQGTAINTIELDFVGDPVSDIAVVELDSGKVPALAGTRLENIPISEDISEWTPTGIFSLVG
jgi:hypothetical protein